jgi:tRNA G18 (ribose-2'-O)-methylase SpoU
MGTLFWKPVVQASFDEFALWTRAEKIQLIGTSARGDVDYHTRPQALILLMGNEQKGLAKNKLCVRTVSLPCRGVVLFSICCWGRGVISVLDSRQINFF